MNNSLKARTVLFLDILFVAGFAFASFLGDKATGLFIVAGLLPIPFLLKIVPIEPLREPLWRLAAPAGLYFGYCLCTYFFFTGLAPNEKRPVNPDLELYVLAIALLVTGTLRGLLIPNLSHYFLRVMPFALLCSFAVLAALFLVTLPEGCQRVKGLAAWPFIPALIFCTLSFLTMLQWRNKDSFQRFLCLALLSLNSVVVLTFTAARGNALAFFVVFGAFCLLTFFPRFRGRLPSWKQLLGALAIGILMSASLGVVTGCGARMISVFSVFQVLSSSAPQVSSHFQISAAEAAMPGVPSSYAPEQRPSSVQQASQPDIITAASFDDFKHADLSAGERFEMWATALGSIREAPLFGHGSMYLQHLITERYGYEHNHNQYLSWLVTGGLLQLSIGLLFLGIPWLISSGLEFSDRLVITLSVSLVWGISMIFDSYFNLKFYTHYYCLLIGLLYAIVNDMLIEARKADKTS
ncbi:hypothetical protein ABID16_003415 [Rhizobium aquaticum]|uniref:O-antigen ligase-related domain-containing protein n=1 Tax=Rhizobium aquaticum TaxID=1549636 RepID=A0ABV2J2T8_9HYPH